MSGLGGLVFLRPGWLWALLALPLLLLAWRRWRDRGEGWRGAVDPHLLPHLLGRARHRAVAWSLTGAALVFALAIVALAGPSWRSGEQPLARSAAPLVIALDLSGAALAGDLPPSRLAQARAKIGTLLAGRAGGDTGLVVWSEDAFTVAPLTADTANVALFLEALSPGIMPVDGHRPERAIQHAARLLQQAGFGRGEILLMTGEGSGAATRAAATAAADGYRVSVIGLGTAAGSAYRAAEGGFGHARLDADGLRALAAAGNGRYQTLRADDGDLRALGVLEAQEAQDTDGPAGAVRGGVRLDDGYWLLLPLLALAALAFRRGGALGAVLLALWLPGLALPPPVHAQARTVDAAPAEAPRGSLWRRADQAAHQRLRAGVDAYRAGEHAAAAAAWRGLPGADAAYNLGNALARAGQYQEAVDAYDEALRRAPGMADAVANRQAVLDAMQQQPPPSGQQQDPSASSRQQGRAPPEQPPSGQQDQDGRGEEGEPQDGDPPPQDAPHEADATADDPQSQQAADEAQRQSMDEALERAERAAAETRDADAQETAESREEREQREANEAWLRRVPDDPGGLLREKFRLEHERRQLRRGP